MTDIPSLILDPRNDRQLLTQAIERVTAASGGQLTDLGPGSPVMALLEGQVYSQAELLWYLNKLPLAVALEVLRLSGVSRSPGTFARGSLNLLLQGPLATPFDIPAGYAFQTNDGRTYINLEATQIPPGQVEAIIPVRAEATGSASNAPAYSLSFLNNLTYVQSVYNAGPIGGGTDLEPLASTLERAQISLRSRASLVSAADYEAAAVTILGPGSRAWAIPFLTSNRQAKAAGHVHLFLLGSDGLPPTLQTCQAVQADLKPLVFAGSSIWASPVEQVPVNLDLTLSTLAVSEAQARQVYQALLAYVNPAQYRLGSPLKPNELAYVARSTPGITEVFATTVDKLAQARVMPNEWSLPVLDTVAIALTGPNNSHATYYLGQGQGDPT